LAAASEGASNAEDEITIVALVPAGEAPDVPASTGPRAPSVAETAAPAKAEPTEPPRGPAAGPPGGAARDASSARASPGPGIVAGPPPKRKPGLPASVWLLIVLVVAMVLFLIAGRLGLVEVPGVTPASVALFLRISPSFASARPPV